MRAPTAMLSERDRAVLRSFAARVDPTDAGRAQQPRRALLQQGHAGRGGGGVHARAVDRPAHGDGRAQPPHRLARYRTVRSRRRRPRATRWRRNPADHDTRRQLADALLLAGEADRAIPHYESLVADSPGDAYALGQLARACKRRGDLDSANTLDPPRAGTASRDDDAFRLLLAELSYHRGLSDDALVVLRDLATRRPDDADVQYLLGFVLGDLGHHAEGAEAARRALRLNPSLGRAEANLSLERRGRSAAVPEPEPAPGSRRRPGAFQPGPGLQAEGIPRAGAQGIRARPAARRGPRAS